MKNLSIIFNSIGNLTDTSLVTLQAILKQNKEFFNSEEVKQSANIKDGRLLGSTLSAISKQTIEDQPLIEPFGKKSLKVKRRRGEELVTVSMPVQVWRLNKNLLENKEEIIKRIEEILKILI